VETEPTPWRLGSPSPGSNGRHSVCDLTSICSDLLSRHVNKCHPALANSGPPDSGKHPKRRACENCAHTGSRCDSNSPCCTSTHFPSYLLDVSSSFLSSLASCVEQNVPCSRMPKAIGHHHTSLPSYADSRIGLPSLDSTVPSFGGHRRNISGSDWSSDSSSRSRSSQYSQPGASGYGFDGTTLDGLSMSRNLSGASGLPLPWGQSGASGSQNLDQSTMTPSQVRAMYGGSLPAGYTHPSQYPPLGGGINLPNPASFPTDSYNSNSFNPLTNYGGTQKSNIGYVPYDDFSCSRTYHRAVFQFWDWAVRIWRCQRFESSRREPLAGYWVEGL
jgi:hypothetical protein